MEVETDIKENNSGHPARSPKFRKDAGYISDRHEYYSNYYQKNKKKIATKKVNRYKNSEALREYHKKKSAEWYDKHRVSAGYGNRTIVMGEDGQRLYSIGHAANAFGFTVHHFRRLTKQGIIPEASYKAGGKWRMYTSGQIRLLKKVSRNYYIQYTTPHNAQAVLFVFWEDTETALQLSPDELLIKAAKLMKKKTLLFSEKTMPTVEG